jgi:hypothetical protein
MKEVALGVLARVVIELPYLMLFWVAECVLIAFMRCGASISWLIYPVMWVINVSVVVLCDLLDQLIDRIMDGKE